jgi:hypothetical protein
VKEPPVQGTVVVVAFAGTTLKVNKITNVINVEKSRFGEMNFSFLAPFQKGIVLKLAFGTKE